MRVVEIESQRLETYLDGELPAEEARALEARLGSDAALAAALEAALEAARAARQARAQVWREMEGDEAAVAGVQARLQRALVREQVWQRRALGLRWFAAAAASVLIGVMLGWSGRAALEQSGARAPGPIEGGIAAAPQGVAGAEVALTDETGEVVAVQSFPTVEAARQFARDLRRWQRQQEQMRDAHVVLVGDRF